MSPQAAFGSFFAHAVVPHRALQNWRIASYHSLLLCCVTPLTRPVSALSVMESVMVMSAHAWEREFR
jgi:hypothetical protein